MPTEKSVGAIIYNRGKYLLLHYPQGHWGFPKGHIEKGETHMQTLRREVEEETGLVDLFQVKGFKEVIHYFFRKQGKIVYKEVTYYLFENNETKVTLSDEHDGFDWLPFHEAMARLTFQNAKEVLRKANAFIEESKKV
ncbi:NUDIX domain-containing protein [Candidatus Woesearchaeota archaeon]|nr:MAG: NUDIX domain-containing protein [Candidatus Woesearchaeota archaeon]